MLVILPLYVRASLFSLYVLAALNILHVGLDLKLIDLDASVSFENNEYVGVKYSSACLPPEMIWESHETNEIGVRSVKDWSPCAAYDLCLASPAHDMWSYGCVLFLLCTGSTLFASSIDDTLASDKVMDELHHWSEETKKRLLFRVKNSEARNLLSLLLNKDPALRPDAGRVLNHPFITGLSSTRLQGEEPNWDVFLSYRVDSDSGHVEELYEHLREKGLSVWWDRKCLRPGQNWEEGFCSGLVASRCVVCLLSRGAIKHPHKPWQNFEMLKEDSKCDNVLLEWRLALELKERGLIEGIYPVMIGDVGDDGTYSDYFLSDCYPKAPDVVVQAVESKLRERLEKEGLGPPCLEAVTVKSVLTSIMANPGGFFCGAHEDFFPGIVTAINGIVQQAKHSILLSDTSARAGSCAHELLHRVRSQSLGDFNL